MSKFILLYNGPATPVEELDSETAQKVMEGWRDWMEKVGSAMIDMGQPMVNGKSIKDDGTEGQPSLMTGYSIIEASSISEATALVDGHPFLSDNNGQFSIEIFELAPIPQMQNN